MFSRPLATRFGSNLKQLRSNDALSDDQIRAVAPSIFAEGAHGSRSARYTYIPTSQVLASLRAEGFVPYSVAQSRCRDEGKTEFTKHMLTLRHRSQIAETEAAPEIILINSHDGTSSYQMLGGMYRFVCANGLVVGDTLADVRVPHKGRVEQQVVEGAHTILDGFDLVREVRDDMRGQTLRQDEQLAFAAAAIEYRYEPSTAKPAPVAPTDLLRPNRIEDRANDLWVTFNRVQENMLRGGVPARLANGRRTHTRAVTGMDSGLRLNRALWVLAQTLRSGVAPSAQEIDSALGAEAVPA